MLENTTIYFIKASFVIFKLKGSKFIIFFQTISNENGELCGHYPIKLVILESEAGQERDK